MSGRIPVGRAIAVTAVITALGYGIMALTTPNEQQFYDSLAPDLRKKVDDSRAFQAAARAKADQLEMLNKSAAAGVPVWASDAPSTSKK